MLSPGEPVGEWALIQIEDLARAAQYAALVNSYGLAATLVKTVDEALFFIERRGPASVIIVELQTDGNGFELLEKLRRCRPPQGAPAVIISGSWALRNAALQRKKELGISQVLAGTQPIPTVRKALALALALKQDAKSSATISAPTAATISARAPAGAPRTAAAFTLEDALVEVTRQMGASMALAWIKVGRTEQLLGHFGWAASIVPMIGSEADWALFRNLAFGAPVHVSDARAHALLRRSPLVADGTVGSFAGVPIVDAEDRVVGALCIAHPESFGLSDDVLEPLTAWGQLLGADLNRGLSLPPPPAGPSPQAPRFQASPVRLELALQQLLLNLPEGLILSDAEGRIAFANPAAPKLLGLRSRRMSGLLRSRFIEVLGQGTEISPTLLAELAGAGAEPLVVQLTIREPAPRTLRWETFSIPVDGQLGRLDRIADVTAQAAAAAVQQRLERVDALTWLGNRRSLDEAMAREFSRALRHRSPVSLVLFRIDQYDDLSPPQRELALRDVAWLLADLVRGSDHVARVDDATLSALLPGARADQAAVLGRRMVAEVKDLLPKKFPRVSLSGGIAEFDSSDDVDQLLARACAALLEAMACGGNGVL